MRTEVKFQYTKTDAWELVDKWNKQIGWNLIISKPDFRHYQHTSLTGGPKLNVSISVENSEIIVQAWLENSKLNQLLTFGMDANTETPVDTAGKPIIDNLVGVIPKTANRSALNSLLTEFGQPQVV